jgi:hypothetical protein
VANKANSAKSIVYSFSKLSMTEFSLKGRNQKYKSLVKSTVSNCTRIGGSINELGEYMSTLFKY